MGFDLTDDDMDYSKEKGESKLLRGINNALINGEGCYSLSLVSPLKMENNKYPASITNKIESYIDSQNTYSNWGMKDPRIVMTYPVWKLLLPDHKIIVIYRNPIDVAYHYTRNVSPLKVFSILNNSVKAFNAWNIYNKQIIKYLHQEDSVESIIFDYDKFLFKDTSIEELARFVSKTISDTRIRLKGKKKNLRYTVIKFIGAFVVKRDIHKELHTLCKNKSDLVNSDSQVTA